MSTSAPKLSRAATRVHKAELVEREVRQGEGLTRREKSWQEPVLGLTDVNLPKTTA